MKKIIILTALLLTMLSVQAQQESNRTIKQSYLRGWEYEVRAGVSIGGTAPLPMPVEIRSIDSYSPSLAIAIEGNATKWFDTDRKWGLTVGLRLENKSMTTEATVKNYGMKIFNDQGGVVEGIWTGGVKTKTKLSLLTLPVVADYKLSSRWTLSFGPYISYLLEGDFSGNVYEGHLRTPDQSGSKVEFANGNIATYDFSDELRNVQWGLQLGGEWRAFKHLNVYGTLTWGLNDIFQKDFDTITFAMYPIYLNVGFGYSF